MPWLGFLNGRLTPGGFWRPDATVAGRLSEGSTVGPNGKTVTSQDIWRRKGKTLKHRGKTTGPGGQTATRWDRWVKNGKTLTRDGARTGPGGKTVTRHDTWTASGKGAGAKPGPFKKWKPKYTGEFDLFGGRPKPRRPAGKAKPTPNWLKKLKAKSKK